MCTFRPPFRAKNIDELYRKVQAGRYDKIPVRYSLMLEEAIAMCLTKKEKRAKLEDLVQVFTRYSYHARPQSKESRGSIRKNKSCVNLIATLEFPKDNKQLATVLPSPKYSKPKEEKDSPEDLFV